MPDLGGNFPTRPPAIVTIAVLAFSMGGVTACGAEEQQTQYVYCVDEQGQVVNPDQCDESNYHGGGIYPYYLWMSPTRYQVGHKVPSNWKSSRISPTDQSARTKAGLPKTGKAGGNTVKSGGVGKGSSSGGGRSGSGG